MKPIGLAWQRSENRAADALIGWAWNNSQRNWCRNSGRALAFANVCTVDLVGSLNGSWFPTSFRAELCTDLAGLFVGPRPVAISKSTQCQGRHVFFFSFFLFFFKIKWMGKNDVRQSNAMAPARSQPATTGWEPWLEATAKTQILVSEYAKFHETESLCLQLRPMFTPIDYGDFLLPSPPPAEDVKLLFHLLLCRFERARRHELIPPDIIREQKKQGIIMTIISFLMIDVKEREEERKRKEETDPIQTGDGIRFHLLDEENWIVPCLVPRNDNENQSLWWPLDSIGKDGDGRQAKSIATWWFHQLPSTSIKFQGDSSREAGSEMSSRKISSSKNNEIGAPIATNLNSIGLIGSDRKDMDICRLWFAAGFPTDCSNINIYSFSIVSRSLGR